MFRGVVASFVSAEIDICEHRGTVSVGARTILLRVRDVRAVNGHVFHGLPAVGAVCMPARVVGAAAPAGYHQGRHSEGPPAAPGWRAARVPGVSCRFLEAVRVARKRGVGQDACLTAMHALGSSGSEQPHAQPGMGGGVAGRLWIAMHTLGSSGGG